MAKRKPPPPIFHIVAAREAEIREIADRDGLKYAVSEVEGRPGIVEFRFQSMDDSVLIGLMGRVPPDAFAYKAVVVGFPLDQ